MVTKYHFQTFYMKWPKLSFSEWVLPFSIHLLCVCLVSARMNVVEVFYPGPILDDEWLSNSKEKKKTMYYWMAPKKGLYVFPEGQLVWLTFPCMFFVQYCFLFVVRLLTLLFYFYLLLVWFYSHYIIKKKWHDGNIFLYILCLVLSFFIFFWKLN